MSNNAKRIWKDQPEEAPKMTLEVIHYKATQLRARTRRELLRNIAIPALIAIFAYVALHRGMPVSPLLQVAFALAVGWALAGQYFLHRGMWEASAPASDSLDLYRREIERRRDMFGRALRWVLGPVLLAVATFAAPLVKVALEHRMLWNGAPFLILLLVWLVAVFVIRSQGLGELKRELDQLNRLER